MRTYATIDALNAAAELAAVACWYFGADATEPDESQPWAELYRSQVSLDETYGHRFSEEFAAYVMPQLSH